MSTMGSGKFLNVIASILIFILASTVSTSAQRHYYKKGFKRSSRLAHKQCRSLNKKKRYKRKHRVANASSKKPKQKPLAEFDPGDQPVASTKPKPIPKSLGPEPILSSDELPNKSFDEMNLDERHQVEDQVLVKNELPAPTSKQHKEIRKKVELQLKGHKDGEPIKLEPLYFTFDDTEFSVVDREPFLVAVEYALQGLMILIEGHTDSHGADNYNVQLSIKRVEKIRELMQQMGVEDDRISIVGYGEEIKSHDNQSETGRQKNRRVDFTAF